VNAALAALAVVVGLVIGAAWLVFGSWVVWMNVNDISDYYQAGQTPALWPFIWIMLILVATIGGGVRAAR
jgi:Ca2+/Na+ antiporter